MANTKIPSELVAINAISGTLIADNAITSVHIAENNITATQIAINAVTALQMADGTITSAKIADGTIVTADIAAGQITTDRLADSAVTTGKIAAGTIVTGDIANNAIRTQHIDDDQITVDQIANNAVGLDQMAGIVRGKIIVGNASGASSYLTLGAANTLLQSDGTDLVFAPLNSGIDDNSNAVAMTIDSSENVGIAISNPSSYYVNWNDLVVGSTSAASGMTIVSGTSHEGTIAFADGTEGDAQYRAYLQYDHSDNAFDIGVAAQTRMRIDSSGRVGINQAPAANNFALQVTGLQSNGSDARAVYFRGAGTATSIGSTGPTLCIQNTNNTTNNIAKLSFESASSGETVSINAINTNHSSHYGDMAFNTRGSAGYSEKMRIMANGNVGIGDIPATNNKFRIKGSVIGTAVNLAETAQLAILSLNYPRGNVNSGIHFGYANANYIQAADDSGSNAKQLTLNPFGGNVGIGTATPLAPLQLNTAGNTAAGTYYSTFTINNTGSSTWSRLRFDRSGVAKWGISLGTDDKFKISNLFTAGSAGSPNDNVLVIDNNSKIGIGTATPDLKLDVSHGTAAQYIATFQNTANNNQLKIGNQAQGYLNIQGARIDNGNFYNFSLQADGGNVGIGTTTPLAVLTTDPESGNFSAGYNNYDGVGLFIRGNGTSGNGNYGPALVFGSCDSDTTNQTEKHAAISIVQTGTDPNQTGLAFWTHPSATAAHSLVEAMRIDASGNVGIGVAPASGIQFQTGNAANGSAVTRVTNGTTFVDLTASSSGKAFLEVGSAHPLILATAATERMRIDATGRVSFGPDASDILIDPASTNGNNNLIYMRGNATGDKSSIQMNHFGSADYFIGVGHAGTGLLNIARDQTGADLVMNTSGNVGIGVVPRARLDVLQATNRTSLTGTARGTLHLQDGDTPANNEITAITFESNSNNASSIIGQKLTNSGSSLFLGTSNNYSAGVTNTGLTINHYGTVSVGAGLELPGYIYNNSDVMKTYSLAGPGASSLTRTVNVNTYWGFAAQGGHFHFSINGWQTDLAAGTIQWHNNGSGTQVITGVQVQNNFSPVGLSVSVAKGSGNYDINITLGSTHSNAHGWVWKVWA